ncbi:MAG TPA: polynucleotide adenylyltransferase PcnB [Planctomycetota bacterium]|nr:polynucleotide adenylyltransferase PcnB [Planctomycetota bacterium]
MSKLDADAVRATQRLIARGFEAYLVGGCVRDLLLDRTPKDYDIATEARPPQVKRTFPRNCRIIGRRFKLAHLHFNNNTKILECSTFRRTPQIENTEDDLLITRDNEFGTAEEDALRRDFTVNALFLDPTRNCILDYTNGLTDLRHRVIRTIGDPRVRFREDPVRILRAAKFAGRLGFTIEPDTFAAMAETSGDLVRAAPPRLFEEILRLLRGGHALDSFQLLRDVGALRSLVPVLADFLQQARHDQRVAFWRLLEALDHRVQAGRVPPSPVLLGALLVGPVLASAEHNPGRSPSSIAEELLGPLSQSLRLPRRDAGCLKRICGVQHRFTQTEQTKRFRIEGFVQGPYFEEALELFELRVLGGGAGRDEVERWHELASASAHAERRDEHGAREDFEDDASHDEATELGRSVGDEEPRGQGDEALGDAAAAHAPWTEEHAEPAPVMPVDQAPVHQRERGSEGGPRRRRRRRGRRHRGDDLDEGTAPAAHDGPVDSSTSGAHEARDEPDGEPVLEQLDPADVPPDLEPPEVDPDEPQLDHGEPPEPGEPGRRRRRRRRRRRGRGIEGAPDGPRREHHGPDVPGAHVDAEQPPETGQPLDFGDDFIGPIAPAALGGQAQSHRAAEHSGEAGTGRRRRRGGRGRNRHRNREGRGEPIAADHQRSGHDAAATQPAQHHQDQHRQPHHRQDQPRHKRRRPDGREPSRRPGGHGGPRDVDVVPRYRDRRGKVEVIEPPAMDLSAFDVELDPKRVPTFGSIVEGKGRPKRRQPRVPDDGVDDYRPPPPPGSDSGPDAPPPPPSSDAPDTFGDW